MATAAPFVKLLRQLTAARDDYRSGALELSWDGGKANIYFVFGQPNHAIFEEGGQHLEGQEAVAALLTKLPRKFTVAPWRKTVVREESLKITMDELMEPFAQLAGETPAEEPAPHAVPPAVGGDTVGTGFEFEFDFGLEDFPLLPMGDTVWSDAAINVVHLDLLIPKLPTSLIVLTGPHLRAAAVTLNGQLIDAVWIDGEVRSTGEAAAMSLMAAREGTMSCYRLENAKLVEAITMLWRCPARYRDMSAGWLNVDAFIDAVMREHLDCVIRVSGKELGFGFFMGGQLVTAYSESSRIPSPTMELLRGLFDSPNARVTVLQRATDRALGTTAVREEAFHAATEGAAIPAPSFAAGMAAISPPEADVPAPASDSGTAPWASKVTVTERDTDPHNPPPIPADAPAPPPGAEEEEEEEEEVAEPAATSEPAAATAGRAAEPETQVESPPYAAAPSAPTADTAPSAEAEPEATHAEAEPEAAAVPEWEPAGDEDAFPNAPMWGSPSATTEPPRWEAPSVGEEDTPPAAWSEVADQEQWAAAPQEEQVVGTGEETGAVAPSPWATPPHAPEAAPNEAAAGQPSWQPAEPEVPDQSAWQQPAAEQSPWQQPAAPEEQQWQQPAAEQSPWQQPAAEESQWQQAAPEEPQWQQPAAESDAWQQPAPDEPQWQQPAGEQPQWQQPAADESAWQHPAASESAGWAAAGPPAAEEPWQRSAADAWAPAEQASAGWAPAEEAPSGGWLEKPQIGSEPAAAAPAWQSPSPNATAAEDEDDYPSPQDLDFDGIKNDLVQIGVLWLGSEDVGPVREMILNTKPSVDDFVATIDAIKSISISGHDPSVIRAMAREMHYHAAEYLSGA